MASAANKYRNSASSKADGKAPVPLVNKKKAQQADEELDDIEELNRSQRRAATDRRGAPIDEDELADDLARLRAKGGASASRKYLNVKQTDDPEDTFDPDEFNTMEEKRYRREKILRTLGFYPRHEDDKDTTIFVLVEHLLRIGAPFPAFRHNGSIYQPQPPTPAHPGYPQIAHPSRSPHVVSQGFGLPHPTAPATAASTSASAKPEEVRLVYIDPWTIANTVPRSAPAYPSPGQHHYRHPDSEYSRDGQVDPSTVGYYHLGVQPRESYVRERDYSRPPSRDGHRSAVQAMSAAHDDHVAVIRESREGARTEWTPAASRYD